VACRKAAAPPIKACLEGREDIFFDPICNMNANDNTSSKQNKTFAYHGQKGDNDNVPDSVIHVRVHPSVRVIHKRSLQ